MFESFLSVMKSLNRKQLNVANLVASENRISPFVRSSLALEASCRYYFDGDEGRRAFPSGYTWSQLQEMGEATLGRLGSANFVNIRPLSGLHAMTVAICALSKPGERIVSIAPKSGGHYATGSLAKRLGREHDYFNVQLGGGGCHESLVKLAQYQPFDLIYIDQCHGLFPVNIKEIVEVARSINPRVRIHADVSHSLGLILGGAESNPLAIGCDSYGGSTHKTFPGPQKGVLLTNDDEIDYLFRSAQFDLISNHHLAPAIALSAALVEYEECGGTEYAMQLAKNGQLFAERLSNYGINAVSHNGRFSGWHQLWIANESLPHGAADAAEALTQNAIMVNLLPDLPTLSPVGLRLGLSELTHLGLGELELDKVAYLMSKVIFSSGQFSASEQISEIIVNSTRPYDYSEECLEANSNIAFDADSYCIPWNPDNNVSNKIALTSGFGSYVKDTKQRVYLDAKGGALNLSLGYGRQDIAEIASQQISKLPVVDANRFLNLPALHLSNKIKELTNGHLSKTLFCNSGSEATEAALKIAHLVQNVPSSQTRFIAFDGGYHGSTQGALSVTGIEFATQDAVINQHNPNILMNFPRSVSEVRELTLALDKFSGTIAAIILEPIQGLGGIRAFPRDYIVELRKICSDRNVILIFDEVLTGFGRTGKMFAYEHFGVYPDILLTSKGLSGGLTSLSAVTMTKKLYNDLLKSDRHTALRHGHTMSGNPVACAISNHVIDVIVQENILYNASSMGSRLAELLGTICHNYSFELRSYGLMFGVDVGDSELAATIVDHCENLGLLIRAQGPILQITPPLTIGVDGIEKINLTLRAAMRKAKVVSEKISA